MRFVGKSVELCEIFRAEAFISEIVERVNYNTSAIVSQSIDRTITWNRKRRASGVLTRRFDHALARRLLGAGGDSIRDGVGRAAGRGTAVPDEGVFLAFCVRAIADL